MTQQQHSRRKQQSLFRARWWLEELSHEIICCSSSLQCEIMRGVIAQLNQRSQLQERSKETLLVLPELLILEHLKVELNFEFSISYSVVRLLGVIGVIYWTEQKRVRKSAGHSDFSARAFTPPHPWNLD